MGVLAVSHDGRYKSTAPETDATDLVAAEQPRANSRRRR
jgi:hypothetical protein